MFADPSHPMLANIVDVGNIGGLLVPELQMHTKRTYT